MEQITDEARLREIIADPSAAIRDKDRDHVDPVTAEFLTRSPLFLLATTGPDGVDVSPRGDPAGCVLVLDEGRSIAFADRKGNRRLDSLRNILHDPRVGMIFLVPGSNDTVRINGRARIVHRPDFAERLTVQGSTPSWRSWSRSTRCTCTARRRSSARHCGTPRRGRPRTRCPAPGSW